MKAHQPEARILQSRSKSMTKSPRIAGGDSSSTRPPLVTSQACHAGGAVLAREKARCGPCAWRRIPADALDGVERRLRGTDGTVSLSTCSRARQLIVYAGSWPGWSTGPTECPALGADKSSTSPTERPRHHTRIRLARTADGHRPLQGTMGWKEPWYTMHRQLRRRLRREVDGHNVFLLTARASSPYSNNRGERHRDHLELRRDQA